MSKWERITDYGGLVSLDSKAAWRAWISFQGAGPSTLAFLLARMAVAPLGPLDAEFRALRGRVLSLGCGHGVVDRYLAEINSDVTVDGIDLDERRVEIARRTEDRCPRVRARVQDVRMLHSRDQYDAALAIDVLHHVDGDKHVAIAADLLRQLRPGGVLLVKEMGVTPRRQYLWNRTHDRIVAGPEPIHCRDPEDMADVLRHAGFEVEAVRRLKRLRIYPQYLVRARRPSA
jgi:2-polyprenyl-3-methyl-5-hydroxy-6-metoxy-1,4-benzoquinol methylase